MSIRCTAYSGNPKSFQDTSLRSQTSARIYLLNSVRSFQKGPRASNVTISEPCFEIHKELYGESQIWGQRGLVLASQEVLLAV